MGFDVTIHDSLDTIDEGRWETLRCRLRRATIYHTRDWHACWLGQFGEAVEPRLIEVSRDGEPLGLLPLMIATQGMVGGMTRRVLTPISASSLATAQYLGPLVGPDDEADVLPRMAETLAKLEGFDAIFFEHYLPGQPVERLLHELQGVERLRLRRWSGELTHWVRLTSNYEDFERSLSRNLRRKLKQVRNRFERIEGSSIVRLEEPGRVDEAVEAFRRQSISRFEHAKGADSSMTDPRFVEFFRDLMHRCLGRERASIWVAEIEGEIVATLFALTVDGWMGYYNGSYAPEHAGLSLGTLLFNAMFSEGIERGLRSVDLLVGFDEYKRHWSRDNNMPLQFASLSRPGLRSLPFLVWEGWKARRAPSWHDEPDDLGDWA